MSVVKCDACAAGKMHRLPFPPSETRAKAVLDLVHSDVLSISHPSLGKAIYIVTFIDDHSRKLWLYFLQRKSDVFTTFKRFKAMVEHTTGRLLRVLRTDGGGSTVQTRFKAI